MFNVRCTGCHRLETWQEAPQALVEVRLEGGGRRPAGPPELAAWRALEPVLSDPDRTVFGACSLCDQPMIAQATVSPRPYSLDLGSAIFVFEHAVTGPGGAIVDPSQSITPLLPEQVVEGLDKWPVALIAGVFGVTMLGCWLSAMSSVAWILIRGAQNGALWDMR